MASLHEKTLSSQTIYEGKIVNLYVDTVQLPDGSTGLREIVRHPGAVAIVPLLPDQRVILVQQYRSAVQQVLIEIPAGTLEPDEEPEPAAIRELQEEIGYKPGKLERLGAEYVAPGTSTEIIHLYLATELTPARLEHDADEFIEPLIIPFSELVARIMRGEITDGKTIAAGLWVARKLGI